MARDIIYTFFHFNEIDTSLLSEVYIFFLFKLVKVYYLN